ncbi:MAG: lamin tail domain-containing protein [Planctomycetales bacterium]|nr:lamin tail domain-containing protein [Planctomycetales bacterium]
MRKHLDVEQLEARQMLTAYGMQAELLPEPFSVMDYGSRVAIDGDTAVVLDSGEEAIHIFRETENTWVHEAMFEYPVRGQIVDLDVRDNIVILTGRNRFDDECLSSSLLSYVRTNQGWVEADREQSRCQSHVSIGSEYIVWDHDIYRYNADGRINASAFPLPGGYTYNLTEDNTVIGLSRNNITVTSSSLDSVDQVIPSGGTAISISGDRFAVLTTQNAVKIFHKVGDIWQLETEAAAVLPNATSIALSDQLLAVSNTSDSTAASRGVVIFELADGELSRVDFLNNLDGNRQAIRSMAVGDGRFLIGGYNSVTSWRQTPEVIGTIWHDTSADGVQDVGELGISDVELLVRDLNDNVVGRGVTDVSGQYRIPLRASTFGTFEVELKVQTGLSLSPADQTDEAHDSDFSEESHRATVAFSDDLQTVEVDGGLVVNGDSTRVLGVTWLDHNGDGWRGEDDNTVYLASRWPGARFELVNASNQAVEAVATLHSSFYDFSEVAPGRYYVRLLRDATIEASTLALTRQNAMIDETSDNDFDRVTATSEIFQLLPNQNLSIDAGFHEFTQPNQFSTEPQVVVTEIMEASRAEFVELTNVSDVPLSMEGLEVNGDIYFEFGTQTIGGLFPGERVVLVDDYATFTSVYVVSQMFVAGQYEGRIEESGDIRIRHGSSNVTFEYDVDWFEFTKGRTRTADARSLILADTQSRPETWSQRSAWAMSAFPWGTPGRGDLDWDVRPGEVIISEVMNNPLSGGPDWIELHNTTTRPIDVGGWFLGDFNDHGPAVRRYRIADNTVVSPSEYLVLYSDVHFGNPENPGTGRPFGISSGGESIYLTAADVTGRSLAFMDKVDVKAYSPGITTGAVRVAVGTAEERTVYAGMRTPTPGAPNSPPLVGPLVINEIMYHEYYLGDEFIELLNVTAEPVRLNGPIRVDGYNVTSTDVIPPYGFMLIVPIAPDDFRAKYDVPLAVPILQIETNVSPFGGVFPLRNDGEQVSFFIPDRLEQFNEIVDVVAYDDESPWPEEADQGGGSLERIYPGGYGNDVNNWDITRVLGGTPGRWNSASIRLPGDLDLNGQIESYDIDALNQMIQSELPIASFDLTGDTVVDADDRTAWVHDIALTQFGDANLDGRVDGADFNLWDKHRFAGHTGWASGDFNGDGVTDAADFNLWNANKFTGTPAQSVVSPNVPRAPLAPSSVGNTLADRLPSVIDPISDVNSLVTDSTNPGRRTFQRTIDHNEPSLLDVSAPRAKSTAARDTMFRRLGQKPNVTAYTWAELNADSTLSTFTDLTTAIVGMSHE